MAESTGNGTSQKSAYAALMATAKNAAERYLLQKSAAYGAMHLYESKCSALASVMRQGDIGRIVAAKDEVVAAFDFYMAVSDEQHRDEKSSGPDALAALILGEVLRRTTAQQAKPHNPFGSGSLEVGRL